MGSGLFLSPKEKALGKRKEFTAKNIAFGVFPR